MKQENETMISEEIRMKPFKKNTSSSQYPGKRLRDLLYPTGRTLTYDCSVNSSDEKLTELTTHIFIICNSTQDLAYNFELIDVFSKIQ